MPILPVQDNTFHRIVLLDKSSNLYFRFREHGELANKENVLNASFWCSLDQSLLQGLKQAHKEYPGRKWCPVRLLVEAQDFIDVDIVLEICEANARSNIMKKLTDEERALLKLDRHGNYIP